MKKSIPASLSTGCFSAKQFTYKTSNMKLTGMRRNYTILFLFVVLVLFTGCADNESVDQCLTGHKYGFVGGLWHGFIAPFDFIGMLFSNEITMYAQNNNGGFYALGFLLGSGGWGFFGSRGVHRVQRRRVHVRSQKFDDAQIVE
jgi:hypothetical protein